MSYSSLLFKFNCGKQKFSKGQNMIIYPPVLIFTHCHSYLGFTAVFRPRMSYTRSAGNLSDPLNLQRRHWLPRLCFAVWRMREMTPCQSCVEWQLSVTVSERGWRYRYDLILTLILYYYILWHCIIRFVKFHTKSTESREKLFFHTYFIIFQINHSISYLILDI